MAEAKLLADLNAFSAAYKDMLNRPLNLPLVWHMDDYGDLWLDNLHLCRGGDLQPDGWRYESDRLILSTYYGSIEIIVEWPSDEIGLITEIVIHKKLFVF